MAEGVLPSRRGALPEALPRSTACYTDATPRRTCWRANRDAFAVTGFRGFAEPEERLGVILYNAVIHGVHGPRLAKYRPGSQRPPIYGTN
jgi:hypothetical protein